MDFELQRYILERINKNLVASGCWEWSFYKDRGGYGNVGGNSMGYNLYGKSRAHQLSYIAFKGIYSKELHVLHLCHNRKCCNPKHLYLGTQKENMRDRDLAGRGARGSKQGSSRLTEGDVIIIKGLLGKLSQEKIALIYGVSQRAISHIKTGVNWSHFSES